MAQAAAPDRDALRRLAELRLDRPLVLSLYLDLDPSEFHQLQQQGGIAALLRF